MTVQSMEIYPTRNNFRAFIPRKAIISLCSVFCFSSVSAMPALVFDEISKNTIKTIEPLMIEENIGGRAPNLSLVMVSLVRSTSYPEGEVIEKQQLSTKYHHIGPNLTVQTLEIGFGQNPIVTMNGRKLPISSMTASHSVCSDPDGRIRLCRNGEIIVGFVRTWDISNYDIGLFTYQITSTNFPNNTESVRLRIK